MIFRRSNIMWSVSTLLIAYLSAVAARPTPSQSKLNGCGTRTAGVNNSPDCSPSRVDKDIIVKALEGRSPNPWSLKSSGETGGIVLYAVEPYQYYGGDYGDEGDN